MYIYRAINTIKTINRLTPCLQYRCLFSDYEFCYSILLTVPTLQDTRHPLKSKLKLKFAPHREHLFTLQRPISWYSSVK